MKVYLGLFRIGFIGMGLVSVLKSILSLNLEIKYGENTFSELFNFKLENQFEYDLLTTIVLFSIGVTLLYIDKKIQISDESFNQKK